LLLHVNRTLLIQLINLWALRRCFLAVCSGCTTAKKPHYAQDAVEPG
jgi:hypothetical protein